MDRFIKKKKVAEMVGFHPVHLMRLAAAGQFPQPIKIGNNPRCAVMFVESEVNNWIVNRIEQAANVQVQVDVAEDCAVYIIQSPDALKFGVSGRPFVRRNDLQGANPKVLRVLYFVACSRVIAFKIENIAKNTFKEHRIHGEWFGIDPEKAIDVIHNLWQRRDQL